MSVSSYELLTFCMCSKYILKISIWRPAFLFYMTVLIFRGEDNHWIAKPWNLGRGMGHIITQNINCLVRLPEAGPFIAMKYLEDPVLYNRPGIAHMNIVLSTFCTMLVRHGPLLCYIWTLELLSQYYVMCFITLADVFKMFVLIAAIVLL